MIVCYHSSRLALLPPLLPNAFALPSHYSIWQRRGGVIGETRRVQVFTFNSSVMLSRPELFSFFKLALFLCGLHNGRCSVEKNPEGGTLITQIDSTATFLSPGTLSLPACAQVPHSHRSHRFLCHVNIIYHLENRLKPWRFKLYAGVIFFFPFTSSHYAVWEDSRTFGYFRCGGAKAF